MHAAEAYDRCAPGYRGWRWSVLWDTVEVPAIMACLPRAGLIIDLGCGYGRYATPCVARGLRYQGVDASEAMLGMATERRATFTAADIDEYRSPTLADAVLCTRVLSNLEFPIRALKSVSENLAPGGTFAVTDFDERHQFDQQTIEGRHGRDIAIPVFRHPAATIRSAIRDAGLILEEERVIHEAAGRPVLVMYRGRKPY